MQYFSPDASEGNGPSGSSDPTGPVELDVVNHQIQKPAQNMAAIAELCFSNVAALTAIDSQSNEDVADIPSSVGQKRVAEHVIAKAKELGLTVEVDENWNTTITIPSTIEGPAQPPAKAFLVHMDTSKGTIAAGDLIRVPNWDGSRLHFPENQNLEVSVERYEHIAGLRGHTVIHGPGKGPFGLDNKLGGGELLTLAELLVTNPQIKHGEILLCFRPDEEIGRHEAVETLAKTLAGRGVTIAWTVDGATPFEINVANFNASRVDVLLHTEPLAIPDAAVLEEIIFEIQGVDTHGATAHEEGYLNAAVIYADLYRKLHDANGISFVDFDRTSGKETTGVLKVVVSGADQATVNARRGLIAEALEDLVAPHRWRGAELRILNGGPADRATWNYDNGAILVAEHLNAFLSGARVTPVLSEQSKGREGYTNPHYVGRLDGGVVVRYRVRDFDTDVLAAREADIARICQETGVGEPKVIPQYVDSGPRLAGVPQLVLHPRAAFEPLSQGTTFDAVELPVRGGTGIDKFTEAGVFVGNVGTGYFFLESPKELTSLELMGQHTVWLLNLVQVTSGATRN